MAARSHALVWLWLSAIWIGLDQWSKYWAVRALLPEGVPHVVIPGLLNWTLAFNPGAAFSFLAGGQGWQRWFFVLLALAVSVVLVRWLWRTPRHDWRTALPLALIVGGAVGNLLDRLHGSVVVDFIHVHYQQWNYPIFNIADCGITVGAVLLLITGLFAKRSA